MAGKRAYLSELAAAGKKDLPQLLRQLSDDVGTVQEKVLLDILDYAKDSEFGSAHGFADIHSVEEYQERVPVTEYEDYMDGLERLKKGGENVFFPGKAVSFAVSSATTGNCKAIPESAEGALAKQLTVFMRLMELSRLCPQMLAPGNMVYTIINSAVYEKSEAGIPMGAASGQSMSAGSSQGSTPLPLALVTATGVPAETMDYLDVLFNAACRSVVALSCNNIAHFHVQMELLDNRAEELIKDIREGTISADLEPGLMAEVSKSWKADPERAAELEGLLQEKGRLTVGEVWPKFSAVYCWTAAGVGRGVKEFRGIFPEGTRFLDLGYGASEGKFNVPTQADSPAGLPTVFGYFFEFLPIGAADPITLEDTKDGCRYELIITSYSGLYRYNIHDIVQVSVDGAGRRNIHFVCKSSDQVVSDGKTLYAGDLMDLVEEYEEANGILFRLVQAESAADGVTVYAEPVGSADMEGFRKHLEAGLSSRGIHLAQLEEKPQGYRDSLFSKSLAHGKTINQTKLPVCIRRT